MTTISSTGIGADIGRVDGPLKVTGTAPYAYEHPLEAPLYLHVIQAEIACGSIAEIDTAAAETLPGVLRVLTHHNAGGLEDIGDLELSILQSPEIHFRGQVIGGVIAESLEVAREAAGLVAVTYTDVGHDTELRQDHPRLYQPEVVNPAFPSDTSEGDLDEGLRSSQHTVDATYTTPMEFAYPMEPHTTVAVWRADGLQLYESTQAVHNVRGKVAELFGLEPERVHVTCPYLGGGFGHKGMIHAPAVLTILAARAIPGRPVKLAITLKQRFSIGGHRTPTIQRIRLGADGDGRIQALAHDVWEHTSKIKEFAEQTAVGSRMMYTAPNRVTTHRLAPLDVPVPTWMRAPGEAPGFFALESGMDELAIAAGIDPIELRLRNEPEADPESGKPWSSRNLVACLQEGAERFGWADRNPTPGVTRDGDWLVGLGVASSTYPRYGRPGSVAEIEVLDGSRYVVRIGANDMGTGTWTTLGQIAADALDVEIEQVSTEIGDTALPMTGTAGGSAGITTWGSAIVAAAAKLREEHGTDPPAGVIVRSEGEDMPGADGVSMHAFGAQFVEVRVDADTGELRVPRMLGVYAAGRIVNPRLARSQMMGGMVMGLSMALHEAAVIDHRHGHVVNHDLAEYHFAANADVQDVEIAFVDEHDPYVNAMGTKGVGELGIVGTAAAVANAVWHATGIRVRELPITADKLLR